MAVTRALKERTKRKSLILPAWILGGAAVWPGALVAQTAAPRPDNKAPSAAIQNADHLQAVTAEVPSQPQEPSYGKLAIPQHPERQPESPDTTRPTPARPTRSEYRTTHSAAPYRRGNSLPMPGRPSRNLAPPGTDAGDLESDAIGEGAELGTVEEADRPGLLLNLPHEWNGVTAEYIYTGGLFTNAKGGTGVGQRTRYRGNFDFVLNFDTEAMELWEGGRLFVYSQNVHGTTLTANEVGDFQLYDNLDSSPRPSDMTQLTELWYQHNFADDVWSFKVGKQDANANFAFTDLGGEFIHSSFGMVPVVPLPTYPTPALGVATFFQPNELFALGGGVYDGITPDQQSKLNRLGTNGALVLLQAQLTPQLGVEENMPGTYRAGVFYHSGEWTDPAGGPDVYTDNHGFWATADQMLWLENPDTDDQQGLGAFFQYGWAPSDRNAAQEYYGGGIIVRGLIPERDEDVFGVGFANVRFSNLLQSTQNQETAIECFYKIRVSPWVVLQPDLMFIAKPNGEFKDAVVPGGRFEVVF